MEGPEPTPGQSSKPPTDHADPTVVGPHLDELFSGLTHGIEWGLERMEGFLRETGNPHESYSAVHIGGTNGKGSVAATIASVLDQTGPSTGLYTSPHLCSFRERFRVAGQPVEEDELRALVGEFKDVILRHELTYFEAATALAFHLFERRGVDLAVVEVGLGGRLDATNVVTPLVSAITNVAKDHSEYLGETLVEIAREKAGIIKTGVPLLTTCRDDDVLAILEETCTRRGAPISVLESDPASLGVEVTEEGTCFVAATRTWGPLQLCTPLVGAHQAVNGALAAAVLQALPPAFQPSLDDVLAGVAGVRWPGRSQVLRRQGRTWLFDAAHNLAGACALAAVLDRLSLPRPVVLFAAVLDDKHWRAILPSLLEATDHAVFTQAPSAPTERRWDPNEASSHFGSASVEVYQDFGAALDRARALAGSGTVVVTGSNHTVGDALGAIEICSL